MTVLRLWFQINSLSARVYSRCWMSLFFHKTNQRVWGHSRMCLSSVTWRARILANLNFLFANRGPLKISHSFLLTRSYQRGGRLKKPRADGGKKSERFWKQIRAIGRWCTMIKCSFSLTAAATAFPAGAQAPGEEGDVSGKAGKVGKTLVWWVNKRGRFSFVYFSRSRPIS